MCGLGLLATVTISITEGADEHIPSKKRPDSIYWKPPPNIYCPDQLLNKQNESVSSPRLSEQLILNIYVKSMSQTQSAYKQNRIKFKQ